MSCIEYQVVDFQDWAPNSTTWYHEKPEELLEGQERHWPIFSSVSLGCRNMHSRDARSGHTYERCLDDTNARIVGVYLRVRISG